MFATVKKGEFEITVFTTGELEAKRSVNVFGPDGIRTVGIWQVKIADLVPEGTYVKKGDYIAELDKTEITTKLKEAQSEIAKAESQFTQVKLDTTLQLRQARDELINLGYGLKEKQIVVEQSAYEPPASIRQAQLDLDKNTRTFEQNKQNYLIKERQLKAKMEEAVVNLNSAQNKTKALQDVVDLFTVKAPEDGMVIYQREWNGSKKIVGSTINAWDPTVATLPDLSVMISKTYVNEVDIRKIKKGQKVFVSLDAFPDKKLTGKVMSVANVGEQNPKTDAKVFEVSIQVNERDTTLRPAMTTGNKIQVDKINKVLFIPLECIHNQNDTISYVFLKNGLKATKQEIQIAQTNENFAVVSKGLNEGDELYLSSPAGGEEIKLVRIKKSK